MANSYREIPYEMLVRRVDPQYSRQLHRELEYVFAGGRKFFIDPFNSGPYANLLRRSQDYVPVQGNDVEGLDIEVNP